MAQTIALGEGLVFTGTLTAADEPSEVPTEEEQLAARVISRLRQGQPKAALAAANDLLVRIQLLIDER